MKTAIDTIPIFYLLAIRFLAAALLLGICLLPRWKALDRSYFRWGGWMGVFLFLAYATQTFGLQDTMPSVNAFLTTIYCVLVPFFAWVAAKKRPDRYHLLAAVLCVIGVGLISLDGSSVIALDRGTLLTLLSGCMFAAHIVVLSKGAEGRDVFLLTAIQFAVAGLLGAVCGMLWEPFPTIWSEKMTVQLFYLTVFCTVITLSLQALGQKYTDPSAASVLLSLESVFAVIFSILFYGDRPNLQHFCGFALIFFAVICSETKLSFFRKRKSGVPWDAAQGPGE
ncbi:MAG: DMT family transporter [Oscillospiraceae bacterium]|nr:DMT family transporter [Oscillospiraceae bacterium]